MRRRHFIKGVTAAGIAVLLPPLAETRSTPFNLSST